MAKGKIRSLVVRTHLGATCENMLLHIVLIMYLRKTADNELWLGTRWRVVGYGFFICVRG